MRTLYFCLCSYIFHCEQNN